MTANLPASDHDRLVDISRGDKESGADVIAYEIRMMRVCYGALAQGVPEPARTIFLEGYLLHYRNLIEFYGRRPRRERRGRRRGQGRPADSSTDMTIRRSSDWAEGTVSREAVEQIITKAESLFQRWWGPISKFLQHCTTHRFSAKRSWPVGEMHDQLEAINQTFERLLAEDGDGDQ